MGYRAGLAHRGWAGGFALISVLVLAGCGGGSVSEVSADDAPVTVVAVGDTSCDQDQRAEYGENGWDCRDAAVANAVSAATPDAVLMLGDLQYECGTSAEFEAGFDRAWGPLVDRMYPVPGNHDYGMGCANQSTSGYAQAFGPRVGGPGQLYYSANVGSWHVVALDSNCDLKGDCGADSPQGRWLANDLAESDAMCTLAVMHHPRFSSGAHGDGQMVEELWQVLASGGVDVVLAGHDHDYERFAAMTPAGEIDDSGMPSFVVGTGGRNLRTFDGEPRPGSEYRTDELYGYLALQLHEGRYEWSYEPVLRIVRTPGAENVLEASGEDVDSGAGTCR